jgi:hypothetical protein
VAHEPAFKRAARESTKQLTDHYHLVPVTTSLAAAIAASRDVSCAGSSRSVGHSRSTCWSRTRYQANTTTLRFARREKELIHVGILVDGKRQDRWYDTKSTGGRFVRWDRVIATGPRAMARRGRAAKAVLSPSPGAIIYVSIAETVNFEHIRRTITTSHKAIDPTGIVRWARSSILSFHGRDGPSVARTRDPATDRPSRLLLETGGRADRKLMASPYLRNARHPLAYRWE